MTEDTLDAILAIKIESTDDNDLKKVLKNLQDIDDLTTKLDDKKNFKKFVDSLSKEGKKPGTKGEQEATGADLESVAKALDKIIKEIGVDSEERDEDLSEDIEDIGEDIGDDVKRSQREIISSIEQMTKTIQSMVFITPNVRGLPSSKFGTMVEALGNTKIFYENLKINQRGKIGENKEDIMNILLGETDLSKFDEKMMEIMKMKAIQGIKALLSGDFGLLDEIVEGFSNLATSFDMGSMRKFLEVGEREEATLKRGLGGKKNISIPELGLTISSDLSTIGSPLGGEFHIKKLDDTARRKKFTDLKYAEAASDIGYEDISKIYQGGPAAEEFMKRYFFGGNTPLMPSQKLGMSKEGWKAYFDVTNTWSQQQGKESPFEGTTFDQFWDEIKNRNVRHDLTLAIKKENLEQPFDPTNYKRGLLSHGITEEIVDMIVKSIQEALDDMDLGQISDLIFILGEAKRTGDALDEAAKQLAHMKGILLTTQTPEAILNEEAFSNYIIKSVAKTVDISNIDVILTQSNKVLNELVDLASGMGLKMGKDIDINKFRDLIANANNDTINALKEMLFLLPVNNNVQGP